MNKTKAAPVKTAQPPSVASLKKYLSKRIGMLERRVGKAGPAKEAYRKKALEEMLSNMYRSLGYMLRVWELEDQHEAKLKKGITIEPLGFCEPCNDGTCPECVDGTPGKPGV